MPHSLETRLASALKPTAAPADLWSRVDAALPASRPLAPAFWPKTLLMAAALTALLSGGVLYLRAQQPSLSTITTAALKLHLASSADLTLTSDYTIQRFLVEGEPVTVVSKLAPDDVSPPTAGKQVHTAQAGRLAVSEWSHQGRSWALVSTVSRHKQACKVCHRA